MAELPTTQVRRRSRSRSTGRSVPSTKPIRVWCPGAFDTLHFGQLCFLRKVKQDIMLTRFSNVEVVAGLYSDEDLTSIGQPPVFTLNERFEMLEACKWADVVCKSAPFEISKQVLKDHNCDYAFFSAEENLLQSPKFDERSYHQLLECGLVKMISLPPSEYTGLSTYQVVNRMMLLEKRDENNNTASGRDWAPKRLTFPNSLSCKEIIRFSAGNIPKPTDKVVYIDGAFDLLHPGHLAVLKKARELGDFLYVGLHSDDAISKYAGKNFPMMQWNERLMALLSCKYVSEVVIDAPVGVDDSLLDAFSVDHVVPSIDDYGINTSMDQNSNDWYQAAKQREILQEFHEPDPAQSSASNSLTTLQILNRVHQSWGDYTYILNKLHSDVEADLDEVNLSQNRDDGDVLKFSTSTVVN